MANYNWSTKIQAYLAKIAGKEVENLPEPTTKEQALLKEIAENGGSSGGGYSGNVIAKAQTVKSTITEGTYIKFENFSLVPSSSYQSAESIVGKCVQIKIEDPEYGALIRSGVVLSDENGIYAYSDNGSYWSMYFGDKAIDFKYPTGPDATEGTELTFTVTVLDSFILHVNDNGFFDHSWNEIYTAISHGTPVAAEIPNYTIETDSPTDAVTILGAIYSSESSNGHYAIVMAGDGALKMAYAGNSEDYPHFTRNDDPT